MPIPDRIERTTEPAQPPQRVREAPTSAEGLGGWFGDRATVDLPPAGLTLAPSVSGTRLTVVESGFAQMPGELVDTAYRGNVAQMGTTGLPQSADVRGPASIRRMS